MNSSRHILEAVVCKYLCVVDSLQSTFSAIDEQYDEPWIRESSPYRVIMEEDHRLSIQCILVCIRLSFSVTLTLHEVQFSSI